MQLAWLVRGLRTGVVTTGYPNEGEPQPESWRGRPVLDPSACRAPDGCAACVAVCLPAALRVETAPDPLAPTPAVTVVLDYGRCVVCGLCVPACPTGALQMRPDYKLAVRALGDLRVTASWKTAARPTDGNP